MTPLIARLGFWSAVVATVAALAFDIAVLAPAVAGPLPAWRGIAAFASGYDPVLAAAVVGSALAIAPAFVVLVACAVPLAAAGRQPLAQLALAFAAGYLVIAGVNYLVQLTLVRGALASGDLSGLDWLVMGNPRSAFWLLEVVGYSLQAASGLFLAASLGRTAVERTVRGALMVNAILDAAALAAYALTVDPFQPLVLASLGVWSVAFPVATASMARLFRRSQTGDSATLGATPA